MSDPKVEQAFKDGKIPDGITKDYLNQTKDAPAIAGIIFVTVFTSIIVLGRLCSRAFLIRRFGVDDILTLISWVSFVLGSWANGRPELTIAGRTRWPSSPL